MSLDHDRSTARFISSDRMEGTFVAGSSVFAVTVRDLSVTGAQIEHANPIRPAAKGRLVVGRLNAPAVIVWTRMSVPGVYRSGLRLEEQLDVVAAELRDLLAGGAIRKGEDTLREREKARKEREITRERLIGLASSTSALSPQQVAMIRNARQWLLTHPHEAVKWYQRAKMTATEDILRVAGSGRMNREDVLAVWEVLERRFDLKDVVRALG